MRLLTARLAAVFLVAFGLASCTSDTESPGGASPAPTEAAGLDPFATAPATESAGDDALPPGATPPTDENGAEDPPADQAAPIEARQVLFFHTEW